MAFWTSALSEPKRKHRFILRIPDLIVPNGPLAGQAFPEYLAKSVTKPSYTVGTTDHKFLGNTYYYPGAVTWNDVTAVIVNSTSPDGNELLYQALQQMGYLKPDIQEEIFTNNLDPSTPNKAAALATLGQVQFEELSGTGGTLGTWKLQNAFITNVTFGDLDYSDEALLDINIQFKYDWATYDVGPASQALNNIQ
tara:strand:+ start:2622 stop:3206 length:585 start_codon:yes stop_codon:yes gene_type:complete